MPKILRNLGSTRILVQLRLSKAQGHNEAAGPRSHRDGVEVQTQPGAARELHRHDAGDGCHPLLEETNAEGRRGEEGGGGSNT